MRQVQKMQDEIRAKQAELEAREYTGTASGEMVTVTMTGKHEVTAVKSQARGGGPGRHRDGWKTDRCGGEQCLCRGG